MRAEPLAVPDVDPRPERVIRGLGVSTGIILGPAHVIESGFHNVPEYLVAPAEIDAERMRFADAVAKSIKQLKKLKAKTASLPEEAAEEVNFLLDAHCAILSGSRLVRGVERRIADERANAEYAVQAELQAIAKQFADMDDAYLASRIQDIKEVGARLIRNLTDRKFQAFSTLPEGSIIVAEELTPADTALMDPKLVAGFATTLGGAEGHTAIMARSLGIPAVLGVAGLLQGVQSGDRIIVDGSTGRVIVNPGREAMTDYERRRAAQEADREQLKSLIKLPARTRDLVDIGLQANLELPREVDLATGVAADGVGLLRTEFMFMNREDLPGEDEQYALLKTIVEGMGGRPVTLRTIDVGGEKLASSLTSHIAESANPALGLRAIRLSLREPKLLEVQLAAMLRAGAHGPTRILLPMITSVSEVRRVRAIFERVARRLKRRKVRMANPLPPLGVMIEVPGAALAADALAQACDFFAIGTNDLIMYTLAIDRGDEQVAHLFDPLHPAVVRLIQFTAEAALRARIPVSVCGEMAGEPRYTALLIGLGIRELSMAPSKLLAVKRRVRTVDTIAASHRARMMVDQSDSGRIAALLDDFNDVG
ncbi:MAG: phosphoenolpyruvate--protein phosphotransferase [Alphaproteobacteria bacterium]|jgi:phosphotransferase system enzyme I (PtsI)|nr:phosphoenolpyruvate--protein phosphotransferase [Alphaproteobacteria bacterium]